MRKSILVVVLNTVLVLLTSVSSYALDSSLFNETQLRLNTEVYDVAGSVFNTEHITQSYNSNSKIFQSFLSTVSPLIPMSISCTEWGGNASLEYTLCPAVASRWFNSSRIDINRVHVSEVDSYFYFANDIYDKFADKSYKGPLQITKYAFVDRNGVKVKYINEDLPFDPYSWRDSCDWYVHNYAHYIYNSWNKNYVFKNQYELVGHMSVMINTGQSYMSSSSSFGSSFTNATFPWKDAKSIFAYIAEITNPENLAIINASAEKNYNQKKSQLANGSYKGNIQLSMNTANSEILQKMNIDMSKYVKPQFVSYINTDSSANRNSAIQSVKEKVIHPIQTIWVYRQMELFYR